MNHIRGLSSIRHSTAHYGTQLTPIILRKLPTHVRQNQAREHYTLEWIIGQLRAVLLKEIKILEAGINIDRIQLRCLRKANIISSPSPWTNSLNAENIW